MIREIEIQVYDRACCRPLMVMDSDEVAQSSVNYHEGYKVRHPLIQVSNDCTVLAVDTTLQGAMSFLTSIRVKFGHEPA